METPEFRYGFSDDDTPTGRNDNTWPVTRAADVIHFDDFVDPSSDEHAQPFLKQPFRNRKQERAYASEMRKATRRVRREAVAKGRGL